MAQQKSRIKPKEWLLLFFVITCVILVFLIWGEAIFLEEKDAPAFVRPTADFEINDDAYENWNATPPTPTPTSIQEITGDLTPEP
ncbi:MAG: hypothetical protein U5K99_10355 [Anaerolineales bacterium]|nr:hypothetical protein [Anaerolineales bacterium]